MKNILQEKIKNRQANHSDLNTTKVFETKIIAYNYFDGAILEIESYFLFFNNFNDNNSSNKIIKINIETVW